MYKQHHEPVLYMKKVSLWELKQQSLTKLPKQPVGRTVRQTDALMVNTYSWTNNKYRYCSWIWITEQNNHGGYHVRCLINQIQLAVFEKISYQIWWTSSDRSLKLYKQRSWVGREVTQRQNKRGNWTYMRYTTLSATPLRSSDIKNSTPSSSITKTTVSAAFLAKFWTSCIINEL